MDNLTPSMWTSGTGKHISQDRNVLYLKGPVRDIVGASATPPLPCATPSCPDLQAETGRASSPPRSWRTLSRPDAQRAEVESAKHHRVSDADRQDPGLGKRHDGRAPDYDDWELNGDILMWNPILERS